jgi:hypothetical protein
MYIAHLRGRRAPPTTYLYCNGKNPKLIPKKSLFFVIVNVELQAKALESDLQTKLNFTGRSEREHAGSHADAIGIVCRRVLVHDPEALADLEKLGYTTPVIVVD